MSSVMSASNNALAGGNGGFQNSKTNGNLKQKFPDHYELAASNRFHSRQVIASSHIPLLTFQPKLNMV